VLTAEKAPTNRTSGSSAVVGHFGYFYKNYPIIAYDGEEAPRDTIYDFRPVHSSGLPHAAAMVARWEDQCMTLCDLLFTLLRTDPAVETGRLLAVAAQRGVPMVVLDAGLEETASLCPWKLLSSRPDQHAAWRGDELPNDSIALIDRVHSACR